MALGALILQGLVVVQVATGARAHVELLGEGDVVSPWVGTGTELNVPSEVTARIASDLRLALLDQTLALRIARWPQIHAALMRRLIARSRRLSMQAAINAIPRIEDRLELTLWHLGDRFGRVTSDGIRLHLPLTHSLLADLLAAQRPSVTTAVRNLEQRQRPDRSEWILIWRAAREPRAARATGRPPLLTAGQRKDPASA